MSAILLLLFFFLFVFVDGATYTRGSWGYQCSGSAVSGVYRSSSSCAALCDAEPLCKAYTSKIGSCTGYKEGYSVSYAGVDTWYCYQKNPEPTPQPTGQPSSEPTGQPTTQPTTQPSPVPAPLTGVERTLAVVWTVASTGLIGLTALKYLI